MILDDEQILNIEGTLKDEQFKVIWDTLKALRSHDERLIDEARILEILKRFPKPRSSPFPSSLKR